MEAGILPSRQELLSRIGQLCDLDNSFISVSGEAGVGKSALLEFFVEHHCHGQKTCFIHAAPEQAPYQIREQVLSQILPGSTFDSHLSLVQNIAACPPSDPFDVVILIDNGEYADIEIYRDLVELLKIPGHRFNVIFASVRNSAQISELNSLHALVEFHLEPLDQAESQMLLSFYYASMMDNDKAQISHFITQSGGIPAKLLQWQSNQSNEKPKKAAKRKKKFKGNASGKIEVKGSEKAAKSKSRMIIGVAAVLLIGVVATATWVFMPPSQNELKAQVRALVESGSTVKPVDASQAEIESETQPEIKAEIKLETNADDEKPALDELLVQKWDHDRPIKDELKFDSQTVEPAVIEPAVAEPEATEPAVAEPEAAEPAAAEPAVTESAATEPQTDKPMDNQWFMTQIASQSMVQLAGVSNKAVLNTYLIEHQLQQKAKIYQSVRNGKPWYVVTLGPYANQNAARSAIDLLSAPLQATQPWAKSIKAIQLEITNAN